MFLYNYTFDLASTHFLISLQITSFANYFLLAVVYLLSLSFPYSQFVLNTIFFYTWGISKLCDFHQNYSRILYLLTWNPQMARAFINQVSCDFPVLISSTMCIKTFALIKERNVFVRIQMDGLFLLNTNHNTYLIAWSCARSLKPFAIILFRPYIEDLAWFVVLFCAVSNSRAQEKTFGSREYK
jgi:hypothetical protein